MDGTRGTILLDGQYGSSGDVSDFNLYYAPGPASALLFACDGFTYSGLGGLQAASGQDANSELANPLILAPFSPAPRLSLRSPAINAGDPNFTPADGETDLLGHPRLLGSRVDIGVIEMA